MILRFLVRKGALSERVPAVPRLLQGHPRQVLLARERDLVARGVPQMRVLQSRARFRRDLFHQKE